MLNAFKLVIIYQSFHDFLVLFKIRELEKRIINLITTSGTDQSAQEAYDKLKKKHTGLEARLVYALKTYNGALGKNMGIQTNLVL